MDVVTCNRPEPKLTIAWGRRLSTGPAVCRQDRVPACGQTLWQSHHRRPVYLWHTNRHTLKTKSPTASTCHLATSSNRRQHCGTAAVRRDTFGTGSTATFSIGQNTDWRNGSAYTSRAPQNPNGPCGICRGYAHHSTPQYPDLQSPYGRKCLAGAELLVQHLAGVLAADTRIPAICQGGLGARELEDRPALQRPQLQPKSTGRRTRASDV